MGAKVTSADISEKQLEHAKTIAGRIGNLTGMYKNINRVLKKQGCSFMYDMHPFNRPFFGEAWKEPKIIKSYHDVMPDFHWRVQDIVNANIIAGLSINVGTSGMDGIGFKESKDGMALWFRIKFRPLRSPSTPKSLPPSPLRPHRHP